MIGIFDSGYGGLTILDSIRHQLPEYDFLYLGDNARAPYGIRSFEVIYQYTLQAVQHLFSEGCHLVILACNTASAKALRTIQQHDIDPAVHRVLGVIRPTVESIPTITQNLHIGILATPGTVTSESYVMELRKVSPELIISQQACPMWVPMIESGEHLTPGADWFVDKYLTELFQQDPQIDTLILGCTHYPLLADKIHLSLQRLHQQQQIPNPQRIRIVAQGDIVANSLKDYLHRHPEIDSTCGRHGNCRFLTTESPTRFELSANRFLSNPIFKDTPVKAEHIELD